MADQTATPQALQWGRAPDGRFFINVIIAVQVSGADGSVHVPVHGFILSKEEEEKLKAALANIVLANSMPNGHNPLRLV